MFDIIKHVIFSLRHTDVKVEQLSLFPAVKSEEYPQLNTDGGDTQNFKQFLQNRVFGEYGVTSQFSQLLSPTQFGFF